MGLLQAMRPRQWTKNLFVLAAMVFTDKWSQVGQIAMAFGLFCAVAGGVYILNDVMDCQRDRLHPVKRNRPIAAGVVPVGLATVIGALLTLGGTALGFLIGRQFGITLAGYLLLQVAYTLVLKHMVLLDVFAIAAGFVLRAVAGGAAIHVPISTWLLVCTLQLALFLGFAKRRHEILCLAEDAGSHRQSLTSYSVPFIDQLISIVLASLAVSYAVYSISSSTALHHPWLAVSFPSVLYGVFRYLYLIHMEHKGGSPETILIEDRPLQVNLLIWLAAVIVAFKGSHV